MDKYQEDEIEEVYQGGDYLQDVSENYDYADKKRFEYEKRSLVGRIIAATIIVFMGVIFFIWIIRPIFIEFGGAITDKVAREDLFMIAIFVLMGVIAITLITRNSKKVSSKPDEESEEEE